MGYPPDLTGGAEHQAALQAQELRRRGYDVTVVCPRRAALRSGVVDGVPVRRLRTGFAGLPMPGSWYQVALALFVLRHLPRLDVLHVHGAFRHLKIVCLLAWLLRRPVYVKVARGGRGGDMDRMTRYPRTLKHALSYPRAYQAISEQIAADLVAYGVLEERIVRIPNGVVGPHNRPSETERRDLRRRLGLPEDGLVVLYLGRFFRLKGLGVLLDAWSGLKPEGAVLTLVGRRRDARGEVEISVDDTSGSVIVRDWTQSVDDYYAVADAFVQPSLSEGMSNALLEAMAWGLPVVATRVGAAESMIEDGASGLLVRPDDVDELREALRCLLTDPELRSRLGAGAANRIAEEYSVGSVVDRIEKVYDAILAGQPIN
jgi:glycosyltransferase involved in cell wall biosynthesis